MALPTARTHNGNRKTRTDTTITRVLLIIDESEASRRAVAYVGRMIGRRPGIRLCLAHVLPRPAPGLREFWGAEHPAGEQRLEAHLKGREQRWIAAAQKTAQHTLAAATAILRRAGVPARTLGIRLSEAVDRHRVSDRILELARARKCDTVVVGRDGAARGRALLRGDLAEELVCRGQGLTLWIVG